MQGKSPPPPQINSSSLLARRTQEQPKQIKSSYIIQRTKALTMSIFVYISIVILKQEKMEFPNRIKRNGYALWPETF